MIKECKGLVSIAAANGTIDIAGTIMTIVGICPNCDKTHLQLEGPGVAMMLDLTPEEAEKIGAALINPEPVKS